MKQLLMLYVVLLAGQVAAQNNNCSNAVQICTDVTFSGNSNGPGSVQELPDNNTIDGCLRVEHQSSWYYFSPVTSGTVALTIQTAVDYDFAIWASGNCSNLGSPVRCSYSAQNGYTGLAATNSSGNTVSDVSEPQAGDRWVMPLNVTAGQTYIMLIDNYTANSTPFTLDWTFTNGATLNCNPSNLPVELLNFKAGYDPVTRSNKISWETASENMNDYFTLERSTDMEDWLTVHTVPGQEHSTQPLHYDYEDHAFTGGAVNYYRLSQTDYDGTIKRFDPIAVKNNSTGKGVVKVVNTMGQEVPAHTPGLLIVVYDDGTTGRIFR
jgi:hypothetical protein